MKIAVYQSESSDKNHLAKALKSFDVGNYVMAISPAHIKNGCLESWGIDMLVIPGAWGSSHYAEELNADKKHPGNGLMAIKNWGRQKGKITFGICAGASFLAEKIIYKPAENGHLSAEAKNGETLGMLPIVSMGPLLEVGGKQTAVSLEPLRDVYGVEHLSLNLAGSCFETLPGAENRVDSLMTYQNLGKPAVVIGKYGEGTVVCSGPHPEYSLAMLKEYQRSFAHAHKQRESNEYAKDDVLVYQMILSGVKNLLGALPNKELSATMLPTVLKSAISYPHFKHRRKISALISRTEHSRQISAIVGPQTLVSKEFIAAVSGQAQLHQDHRPRL